MKPNRFNTVIVIVTYNPEDDFYRNLRRHLEICNYVVVVDNNSTEYIGDKIKCYQGVHYIQSVKNNGIAWGLNQGIKYAINNKFEYVLTFDQDSYPIISILDVYAKIIDKETNIGLLGTSFSNKLMMDEKIYINYQSKLTIITSGALHPISIFDKVGLYNEKLFIDSVDFDFSLRVKKNGYNVMCSRVPLIEHKLGNPLKRNGIKSTNHSAIRRYYQSRNHIYMLKTYWRTFPLFCLKMIFFIIIEFVSLVIVEDNLKEKIIAIRKGVKDGINF